MAFFRLLMIHGAAGYCCDGLSGVCVKIDRPAGFLLNWNTNSAFLGAVLLPYCVDYLRRVTLGRNRLLPRDVLACCAFGMSLGQGRGSLFALAIGLSLLFFAYRKRASAYRGIALTLAWVVSVLRWVTCHMAVCWRNGWLRQGLK